MSVSLKRPWRVRKRCNFLTLHSVYVKWAVANQLISCKIKKLGVYTYVYGSDAFKTASILTVVLMQGTLCDSMKVCFSNFPFIFGVLLSPLGDSVGILTVLRAICNSVQFAK